MGKNPKPEPAPKPKRKRKRKTKPKPKWRHHDILIPEAFGFSKVEDGNIRTKLKEKADSEAITAFIRAAESEVEGFLAYRRIEKTTPRSAESGAALTEIHKTIELARNQLRNLDSHTRNSVAPHLDSMPQRLSQGCLPDYRAAIEKWRFPPTKPDGSEGSVEFDLNAPENVELKAHWNLQRAKFEADCKQLFRPFRDYTDVTAFFLDGICEAIALAEDTRDKSGGGPRMEARAQFIRELAKQFKAHLGLPPSKTQDGVFEGVVSVCLRAAGDEIDSGTLHNFIVASLLL